MDNITFEISTKETLKTLLHYVLGFKLHLYDGQIKPICERALLTRSHKQYTYVKDKVKHCLPYHICGIVYHEERPVGVILTESFKINFYIVPKYRRQGLMTRLHNEMLKQYPDTVHHVNADIPTPIGRRFLNKRGVLISPVPFRKISEELFKTTARRRRLTMSQQNTSV